MISSIKDTFQSMKRIMTITLALLMTIGSIWAQTSAVKNAAKSVFTLNTYNSEGLLTATSHGVFVGDNGECISDLRPFVDAAKATVTDAKGNTMNVTRILGVNDLYNVIRFRVDGKTTPLPLATQSASSGQQVWLVSADNGKTIATPATVNNVEQFMDQYAFYILALQAPDNTTSCPFVNQNGEVIGIQQASATSFNIYAVDARFVRTLCTNGMSLGNSTMRKIGIPMALPADKEQALLTLMMSGEQADSIKRSAIVADFIAAYPEMSEGYAAEAQMALNAKDFDRAAQSMETAIKKVTNKDEAHFEYGKIIYNKELYLADHPYKPWSLDKALDEVQQAYAINPLSNYQYQAAQIIFSQGAYEKAYEMFMNLTHSDIRNPEQFYGAARCKQLMQAPEREVIALLDSAIVNTDTLRLYEAAPYFLLRGQMYNQTDSFRQAVFDYTRYEILSNGQVNDSFYYMRHQAEVKGRLYKQALSDITAAILLNPREPMYYAEKASLELKVNRVEDAMTTAGYCVKLAPEYAEGWLLLGLAQVNNNMKQEGLKNMAKAKELGNEQAQSFIDKYEKEN